MKTHITREEALELLRKYNQEPFHLEHGITVGKTLRWFAEDLGYGDEADFWEIAGLLHDVDFEKYPEEHCKKAPELLAEVDAEPELVHAICSHGYGLCSDVKPEHEMEKVLFAAGCSRDVIRQGAENLGWELDTLLQKTLTALQTYEEEIRKEMEKSA